MPDRPRKLLDAVRETIRLKHYSPRTEEAYVHWITRFVRFHNKRHPREMAAAEIEAFLTHLAVDQHTDRATLPASYPRKRVTAQGLERF